VCATSNSLCSTILTQAVHDHLGNLSEWKLLLERINVCFTCLHVDVFKCGLVIGLNAFCY